MMYEDFPPGPSPGAFGDTGRLESADDGGMEHELPPLVENGAKMIEYPIVKIEIEHMRQAILHAMGPFFDGQEQVIEEQLNAIVDKFDFASVVEQEAQRALQEQLVIAVKDAVRRAFSYSAVTDELDRLAIEHLQVMLSNLIAIHRRSKRT